MFQKWFMEPFLSHTLTEFYEFVIQGTILTPHHALTYFLFVFQGTILTPQHALQPEVPLSTPGVLSSNFYNTLLRRCFPNVVPGSVACYELMMMHIGLVNLSYITENRIHLTAMLRNNAGDSVSPRSFTLQ